MNFNSKKLKYLFFSLRPKHWAKNLFIFLPIIFGKKFLSFIIISRSFFAFLIFSLGASSIYLLNDILDLKEDKLNPLKRLRPIASGRINLNLVKITIPILSILSIVLAAFLDIYFSIILSIYILFNILYSRYFKKIVIIDVFCLSFFFLLRILAGCSIAKVKPSPWIIIMTILLALFLGLNKRRQELRILREKALLQRSVLKKYNLYFIDQLLNVITPSIVITYILYLIEIAKDIKNEYIIYTTIFVYYGIFRYLYLIHQIRFDGDPIRILWRDKILQLDIILWLLTFIIVLYF